MSLTGNKDVDREILRYISNENLLKVCTIDKKTYNETCDDNFLKRRLTMYPNIENYKLSSETWKHFFTKFTYYTCKMKKEFDFQYVHGDFENQYGEFKSSPNKLVIRLRKIRLAV